MDEISLDELIGNLQTYELRKNSQVKEETRKDQGLALKVVESDDSDLDDEVISIITRTFKKFVKKPKENFKKGITSKTRSSDRDQTSGCFRCGKLDHIVKYCPMQKEEQASEQFRNQGKKPQLSGSAKRYTKAMAAAWGETLEGEDSSQTKAKH